MEDNNKHPSLPSNYVTLAQLQERWLKQKEKEKQLQEKHLQEQQQKQQQQRQQHQQQQIPKLPQRNPREYHGGRPPKTQQQAWRAIPSSPTGFGHASSVKLPLAESGPENPNVPDSNRVAVEVSREKNEIVKGKADIGDGNDGQDGERKRSKEKRKSGKQKPRADEERKKLAEDATESTMVGNKEVEGSDFQRIHEKTETEIELNDGKSNDLTREVEQKLGTVSMNSENEKHDSRVKTYDRSRGSRSNNGGRNHRMGPYGRADKEKKKLAEEESTQSTTVGNKEAANSGAQRIDEKTGTKFELNDGKSNGLTMKVEQKLGTTSMNSENEKHNSRVKTYDSSRGSQRNNGGCNYRIRPNGRSDKEKRKLAEEESTQSTMVGNKEAANSDVQRETKIELNDGKSNDLMLEEVEQKLGTISMNAENDKHNSRIKTYDSSRGSQRNNGGRNNRIRPFGRADKEKEKLAEDATESTTVGNKEVVNSNVQRVDDKRETKIELNGSKRNDLMIEVEQKLGTISVNSEDEKKNGRDETYDRSRGSQMSNRGRNFRTGPYGDGNSNFGPYGGRFRAHKVQRQRVDQKIWVRKSEDSNGNVDHNEIPSK